MSALLAALLSAGESDGMSADELARFNKLPAAAAQAALLTCCNSLTWVERMLSGRPYSSAMDAIRQSRAIVARLAIPDLEAALAGHPRIGEKHSQVRPEDEPGAARSAQLSAQEQAAVADSDADTATALAESNLEYEERFGHIYLVCATGKTGPQLLALLRARLSNSPAAEWQVVRTELQKINEIRLRQMLAALA